MAFPWGHSYQSCFSYTRMGSQSVQGAEETTGNLSDSDLTWTLCDCTIRRSMETGLSNSWTRLDNNRWRSNSILLNSNTFCRLPVDCGGTRTPWSSLELSTIRIRKRLLRVGFNATNPGGELRINSNRNLRHHSRHHFACRPFRNYLFSLDIQSEK